MSFINYMAREINCKIVYYGPGLCGKTTNLQYIYERTNPEAKGKMISLATETERTLFFDFLPLSLGEIRGFKTRFHLYTVPGQVFYDASRKLILKGVDGVIFVADSQIERLEANQESIENLRTNLAEQGYSLEKIPYVIQYNKRDLPNIRTEEEIKRMAALGKEPTFLATATHGTGVAETFLGLVQSTWEHLEREHQLKERFGLSGSEVTEDLVTVAKTETTASLTLTTFDETAEFGVAAVGTSGFTSVASGSASANGKTCTTPSPYSRCFFWMKSASVSRASSRSRRFSVMRAAICSP